MGYLPSSSFSPFAARTGQYIKEQFTNVDDKVYSVLPILEQTELIGPWP